MKLPTDNPETFKGIPLNGHLCALKRGDNKKYYWRVERLIQESKRLNILQSNVEELISRIENGSWFAKDEKVTIKAVLSHVKRALKADLNCPIIIASDGKVMDGSHRLMAAMIKGAETLPSVQFEQDPEPDYIEEY
jgi:hypothetical protein